MSLTPGKWQHPYSKIKCAPNFASHTGNKWQFPILQIGGTINHIKDVKCDVVVVGAITYTSF